MKILILGFTKIKYMPYMNFYLDNINMSQHEVHLLYWNRDLKEEDISLKNIKFHEFKYYQEDEVSKVSKIKSFFKYRNYAINILRKEKFDFVIALHSLTGVIISDKLKKYKNNYIFDYRDSTYEKFLPFKWIIGELVKNSYATFVSSDGFRRFLPQKYKNKIYTSHNLLQDSLKHREDKEKYGIESNKIRIAFWGFIRHEEINIEIIKKVSLDDRFELHYYGKEQQTALKLKKYVLDNNIKNVFFHGEYKPEERYKFILQTDIIHNVYFDNNMMLAMGNKYYDGVIFRIPQICMKGSFMGEIVEKCKVGFECNPYEKDFFNKIYDYYNNLDCKLFNNSCNEELNRIMKEYNFGVELQKNIYGDN